MPRSRNGLAATSGRDRGRRCTTHDDGSGVRARFLETSAPMRFSSVLRFVASALAVSALSVACQQQGEGDVCDPRAGNAGSADCQNGLVCIQIANTLGERCCPGDPALRTGVCAGSQMAIMAGSAPPDAATDAATEADAGGEEPGDSSAGDALSDAALDTAAPATDGAPE